LVSLRGVFHSSPLGNLLRPVFEDESIKNEAAMNYLNDFLHMMYKPMVEGELQVNVMTYLNYEIKKVVRTKHFETKISERSLCRENVGMNGKNITSIFANATWLYEHFPQVEFNGLNV
jgi:hypothetical protein